MLFNIHAICFFYHKSLSEATFTAEWETPFGERYELSFLSTRCEVWKYNYSCLHRRKWKHRAGLCEASQQSQGQSDVKFQRRCLAELALPLPGRRKWHAGGCLCGKMGRGGLERWLEQGENIGTADGLHWFLHQQCR